MVGAAQKLAGLSKSSVRELRFHFCQKGATSKGMRDFVNNFYPAVKNENQDVPFLIREAGNIDPKIIARYENGVEKMTSTADLTAEQIVDQIAALKAAGKS
eukprot:Clim_evm32s99 gene=Clim_evmTU32s99